MLPLYDAHNHLQDVWLAPHREAVFADLERVGVRRAVVNGTSVGDWPEVAELASRHALVLPSFGLHPWDVGNAAPGWRDRLRGQLDAMPGAAVGEIGLDRWILDRAKPDDPRLAGLRRASLEEQIDAFSQQLELAADRNLPVTVHCLDAWGTLARVLRDTRVPRRGFLLHAYGGSTELARQFADLGAYFSFNGYFLGARQAAKCRVFRALPIDRILVETDAPAMPLPPEHRRHSLPPATDGSAVNHPANIDAAYAGLAEERASTIETLAPQIEANFRRLFG